MAITITTASGMVISCPTVEDVVHIARGIEEHAKDETKPKPAKQKTAKQVVPQKTGFATKTNNRPFKQDVLSYVTSNPGATLSGIVRHFHGYVDTTNTDYRVMGQIMSQLYYAGFIDRDNWGTYKATGVPYQTYPRAKISELAYDAVKTIGVSTVADAHAHIYHNGYHISRHEVGECLRSLFYRDQLRREKNRKGTFIYSIA